MSRRVAFWLLLAIIIVGVGIRSYELTARSLWFDEAFTWRLIQFPLTEMIARDAMDVHPPLYYLAVRTWSVVFGSSLLALRSFSIAMAGLTMAAAYLFVSYAWHSRKSGLLAAALLALSGFQIQFAWEARMYTLGTALVLLSSWLLLVAVRQTYQRRPTPYLAFSWAAYAGVTTAFAYVHYYAFFSIAAQVVFLIGYQIVRIKVHSSTFAHQWRLTWYAAAAGLIMVVLYSPWLPTLLTQNAQVQEAFWIPSIGGWSIPDTFYRMFAPTPGIPRHLGVGWITLALLPLIGTVLGWLWLVAGRANHRRKTTDAAWLIMLSGSVPFVLSILASFTGQSLYQDRFFVFAHLFIVIALAVLLSRLPRRQLSVGAGVLVLVLFLVAHISFWRELDFTSHPGAHAATQSVIEQYQSGEPILVSSPFIYFAVAHYVQEEYDRIARVQLYSASGELQHFAGGPILTTNDIIGPEIFNTTVPAIWVVDTTGFGASALQLPAHWKATQSETYSEVFGYQGEIIVTRYER